MTDAAAQPLPAPAPAPKPRFPSSSWLSVAAFVMSLAGASMVILSQFFAPKSIEVQLATIEEKQKTLDWRVETVRVNQENGAAQIQTLNVNMARLLGRFDVEPAPPAAVMAVPPDPAAAAPLDGVE